MCRLLTATSASHHSCVDGGRRLCHSLVLQGIIFAAVAALPSSLMPPQHRRRPATSAPSDAVIVIVVVVGGGTCTTEDNGCLDAQKLDAHCHRQPATTDSVVIHTTIKQIMDHGEGGVVDDDNYEDSDIDDDDDDDNNNNDNNNGNDKDDDNNDNDDNGGCGCRWGGWGDGHHRMRKGRRHDKGTTHNNKMGNTVVATMTTAMITRMTTTLRSER